MDDLQKWVDEPSWRVSVEIGHLMEVEEFEFYEHAFQAWNLAFSRYMKGKADVAGCELIDPSGRVLLSAMQCPQVFDASEVQMSAPGWYAYDLASERFKPVSSRP